MQNFTARLQKRMGTLFGNDFVQLPPSIQLMPRKWSASDIGGPKAATIEAAGSLEDLAYLLTWLGDRAVIDNEMGSPVWWGVVYEIEANLGHVTVTLSLDTVYNKVAVIYPYTLPDGSTESRQTDWASDGISISRYGERQLLYSLPEGVKESAEAVRDRLLAQYADPPPMISTRTSHKVSATLHCRGHWAMLDSQYWTNEKGLAAHEGSGGGVEYIGAALTDTTISFGAPADPDGSERDFIADSGARFGLLVKGTVIHVSGAAQADNNKVTTVQKQFGNTAIETVENTQVDENAGATVTIAIGPRGRVGWVSQSFQIPSSSGWTATHIALRLQRVGTPGDNLTVSLNPDDGGNPDSSLATGSISGMSVPTSMNWVEIPLSSPVPLSPSTTYWVTVGRSGAPSLTGYYVVGLDESVSYGEVMKVHTGGVGFSGSWVARDPDANMPFRVFAEVDSIDQLREALDVSPEFLSILGNPQQSGVTTRQYRGHEVNVLDEALSLLDLGTSNGKRLLALVDYHRNIVIAPVPESSSANPVLGIDGRLHHAGGALWEPGALVAGRWIDIDVLPVLDGLTATKGGRAVYVQECEYDAQSGRLIIQSEGALDPWQAMRWERR